MRPSVWEASEVLTYALLSFAMWCNAVQCSAMPDDMYFISCMSFKLRACCTHAHVHAHAHAQFMHLNVMRTAPRMRAQTHA